MVPTLVPRYLLTLILTLDPDPHRLANSAHAGSALAELHRPGRAAGRAATMVQVRWNGTHNVMSQQSHSNHTAMYGAHMLII